MAADAVLTVEAMRAAERDLVARGVSEWKLMQRAGTGAAEWIARVAAGRAVAVLCGPGNNGGDGYVIAEALRNRGHDVTVVAPLAPKSATAARAREAFRGIFATAALQDCPVIVDCLFGYGLDRPVEGVFAQLLESLCQTSAFKIAIHVPSAVASDTGNSLGPLPRYDLTLALGAWKPAHFLMPAMARMGTRRLVPIGLDVAAPDARLSSRPLLAAPEADSHKYRRGLLAVVAGAMPGAPLLASQAAMRAGAGYVKLVSAHSHPDAPADLVIVDEALDAALSDKRIDAILIGPGLGRDEQAHGRLASVLKRGGPTVLDADALHLLTPELLEKLGAATLCLTPHEGELSSLCKAFGISEGTKLDRTRALCKATGAAVLAKGPDTILAGADGQTRFFPQGSSWLSTAGTGDVLAGIIASRLAHHGDPLGACEEGVWLQHEAARLAGPGFTAGELALTVRDALRALT